MTNWLTPQRMLAAYARGIFPMAESAADRQLYWFDPEERGILPVGGVHLSRSMRRFLRLCGWHATVNHCFDRVVLACADREETWINAELRGLYQALHQQGHAHSLEVWQGDELVGGVYGLSLGGAFFAESMFSRRPNGSKAALIWLSDHLRRSGFTLWDTQYPNPHLDSMGGLTIDRQDYLARLDQALGIKARFLSGPLPPAQALLQLTTQTS